MEVNIWLVFYSENIFGINIFGSAVSDEYSSLHSLTIHFSVLPVQLQLSVLRFLLTDDTCYISKQSGLKILLK